MKVYLFACIEKNIGDDLFVEILCRRYPNVEFIITSRAEYGSLKRLPNLRFSDNLEKWSRASTRGQRSAVKAFAAKIIQSCYRLALPRCKVGVSIVGNAFKNKEYTGWTQSRWIRERVGLVKSFYLMSTNFGPYTDENWKKDFDKIFASMSDVCFRDHYSYDLFSHLPNVRFAPDAVISMGKQNRTKTDSKNVIISLIDCSFGARGEELKKAAASYESKMCELICRLTGSGYNVTLLNSNTEQDRPACDRILKSCSSDGLRVVDYDGDTEKVMELYRTSDYVIATRLHTIVLAWLFGIPVVPIVYDIKVNNLLDACNFTGRRFMITESEKLSCDSIIDAMNQYDFVLSEEIIALSELQFKALDRELGRNN